MSYYVRGGRYLNEEESFLVDDKGYQFTLKEKPDLDSLEVLIKRDRNKGKAGYIWLIVLGFVTLPLFLVGIFFFILAWVGLTRISTNNEADFECVYYNEEKNTIVFRTIIERLWLEFEIDRVKDVYNKDINDMFGLIVNIGDKEEDNFYFKIGYATTEEKMKGSKRIKRIKENKLNQDF